MRTDRQTDMMILIVAFRNVAGAPANKVLRTFYVTDRNFNRIISYRRPDPSGCAVYDVGLRPLACGSCGFGFRRVHEGRSFVSVVSSEVEVSASGWSLVQRNPAECGVAECDREASIIGEGGAWPTTRYCALGKKNLSKEEAVLPVATLQRCIVAYRLINYLL
jgi:hypothetical protein